MSIFVSIAAYRDSELEPTIADCIAKARYPRELRFGVCWQHGPEEKPFALLRDPRVRVIDCDWRVSRGTCWARAQVMGLWDGEDFYLQLDSHHRFAPHWDAKLRACANMTQSPKPLLTTYCPSYELRNGAAVIVSRCPTDMAFSHYCVGLPAFRGVERPEFLKLGRPLRARFASGHYVFTVGSFVPEVPYDPGLYYFGEEIMLAIRAYTSGYDLFHPHDTYVWHQYGRDRQRRHWDDHTDTDHVRAAWYGLDVQSQERIRAFIAHPWTGKFGCGTSRSFSDYEAYAGLKLNEHLVNEHTIANREPPTSYAGTWRRGRHSFEIRMEIPRRALTPDSIGQADFWYAAVHALDGTEVGREDLTKEEIARVCRGTGARIVVEREFYCATKPVSWTIWPFAKGAWQSRSTGRIA